MPGSTPAAAHHRRYERLPPDPTRRRDFRQETVRLAPPSLSGQRTLISPSVSADRDPGPTILASSAVVAMSRGSLPGLFWRHPTEEEPWARSSHPSPHP